MFPPDRRVGKFGLYMYRVSKKKVAKRVLSHLYRPLNDPVTKRIFLRWFLTETVYDQPLSSDVLGAIYPNSTQFWFIINGPIILFATFFETPCMNGDDDGLNPDLHAIPLI